MATAGPSTDGGVDDAEALNTVGPCVPQVSIRSAIRPVQCDPISLSPMADLEFARLLVFISWEGSVLYFTSTDARTARHGIFLGKQKEVLATTPHTVHTVRDTCINPLNGFTATHHPPRAPKRPRTCPMPFPCHDELDTSPIIPPKGLPDLDTGPSILCSVVLNIPIPALSSNPTHASCRNLDIVHSLNPLCAPCLFNPCPRKRKKKRLQCCPDLPNAMTGSQTDPVHTTCPVLPCPVHCKHRNSPPKPSKHPKHPSPAPLMG